MLEKQIGNEAEMMGDGFVTKSANELTGTINEGDGSVDEIVQKQTPHNAPTSPLSLLQQDCPYYLTPDGLRRPYDLTVGQQVLSLNGWATIKAITSRGMQPVTRYSTNAGQLICGPDQKVMRYGLKAAAGREIDIFPGIDVLPQPEQRPEAVMAGYLIGSGRISGAHSALPGVVCASFIKTNLGLLESELAPFIGQHIVGTIYAIVGFDELKPYLQGRESRLVPDKYLLGDLSTIRGFVRGFYSAQGHLQGRARIEMNSFSLMLVRQLQLMLSALGIFSFLSPLPPTWGWAQYCGVRNSGEHGWRLTIARQPAMYRFRDTVGFIQPHKQERLKQLTAAPFKGHVVSKPKSTFEVTSSEEVGQVECFSIQIQGKSSPLWCNGLLVLS